MAQYLHGGWYGGKQWNANTQSFGGAGVINNPEQQGYGQAVSKDVVSQTSQKNVSFVEQQQKASGIQAPVTPQYIPGSATNNMVAGLNSEVEKARKALESTLSTQKAETESRLKQLREKESQTLEKVGALTTPFREDLEKTERERLNVNKNFEENQKLVDELDTLLTEGNNLIQEQQSVTGLAAVRNPRIQKTMNDVAARVGVIEAVMNARNGQISQAYTMIDRTVGAITQDRNDQINYYNTILNLTNRDILSLDAESKRIAKDQVDLLKGDLAKSEATVAFIKEKMLDPAYAQLMGDAGVTLNDSVEVISTKLAQAQYTQEVRDVSNEFLSQGATAVISPNGVPASQLRSFIDSRGVTHYYKLPAPKTTPADKARDFDFEDPTKNNTTNVSTTQKNQNTPYPVDLTESLWLAVDSMTQSLGAGNNMFTSAGGSGR